MMEEWKDYIASVAEANTFKNRIRSYISDRNELLDAGGQKNSPPYTKKMSTHVTFDQQLKEVLEVDPDSFKIHEDLDPQIWNDEKIEPEIRKKLLKIATDFIEGLPIRVKVEDITLTGSLANYNWSKFSDVDLHIIVNFEMIDENEELVKGFFDAQRMRWNEIHDITRKKAVDIDEQTKAIESDYDGGEYDKVMRNVERLKNKIRSMRSAGLESELMEFSPENIAFKMLRRAKVLNKLTRLKYNSYDQMNTLDD